MYTVPLRIARLNCCEEAMGPQLAVLKEFVIPRVRDLYLHRSQGVSLQKHDRTGEPCQVA